MPSVQSRPLIESDGNNVALRRIIRLLKKLVTKASNIIMEGGILTEEVLDALGSAVIQLLGLIGYPLSYCMSMPEIFEVFTGKPLPTTLPLIFVLHIILLIYSTYVLCYMPAVGLAWSSAESISFHIITGLAIISYYRGVVTDPGRIPGSPEWEKENADKKSEGLRFCSREKKWKPERTHYCSALGRNVLRMDHMCPCMLVYTLSITDSRAGELCGILQPQVFPSFYSICNSRNWMDYCLCRTLACTFIRWPAHKSEGAISRTSVFSDGGIVYIEFSFADSHTIHRVSPVASGEEQDNP
jgi:hypothetical protein